MERVIKGFVREISKPLVRTNLQKNLDEIYNLEGKVSKELFSFIVGAYNTALNQFEHDEETFAGGENHGEI